MAAMGTVEIDAHVSVGIVRPGDKLVIAVNRRITAAEADALRKRLEARLPGIEVVPVEAVALMAFRPDTPPAADGLTEAVAKQIAYGHDERHGA